MNHFKSQIVLLILHMVLKSCKPKVFKSGKTFKSSWRPYNSQFYADGTPKTPGYYKDGTPRMKGIGKGRRY